MAGHKSNHFLKPDKSRDYKGLFTEKKNKNRSQSLGTIFGMPIKTLSFYQPSERMNILKHEKSNLKIAE